ncbi:MAG: T9SS type A sorting domain-containing protein, partial [candidate division Zixibacteria bacterium]|nr:T9SS type A sorting domain-containing protein [candidate division Zixibacteria bacterium]
ESFDEHDGLEYVFCRYYDDGAASLVDGRSLLITTNTGRGRVNGQATLSDNSDNSGIMAMTSTGQRGYTGYGGSYFIKDAEVDNVDIQFSNKGYYPALLTGINVAANMPTDADAVTLNPAPVPTNLSATEGDDDVVITWDEADPSAIGYDVYRSRYQNGLYRKLNDNPITGLSYTDSDVMPGRLYWYYTEAVYEDAISFASNKDSGVSGQVDIDENDESLPKHYSLNQNYPNPFNPTTVIDYALPTDCDVNLSVYNVMGQRVVTLVNENKNAGYHSIAWDGHTGSGAKVSSGIYFYRLDTKDFSKVRRMMLLK